MQDDNNSGRHRVCVCVHVLCSVSSVCTCQCVLCALNVVHNLPVMLVLDSSQTLVVGFSVLEDVMVDLAVLHRHSPDDGHCVVHHHTVLDIDFWSTGD